MRRLPSINIKHPKSEDCLQCMKDKNGRATGYYVAREEKRKCKPCNGTGKYGRKKCRVCVDGVFYWRSPMTKCKSCNGTGKKRGPRTAMEHAFDQIKKAL